MRFSGFVELNVLLDLAPEEVGGAILEFMQAEGQPSFSVAEYFRDDSLTAYPAAKRQAASEALVDGLNWLRSQGLIVESLIQQQGLFRITRRGRALQTREQVRAYRAATIFPDAQLHPSIVANAKAAFVRGEYDTAVFQAFREVEIAVRDAGRYAPADLGVDLMRKAFKVNVGPLTNRNMPVPEQLALQHLFVGAIGSYKNPCSHRNVALDAQDALEMIVLASHLLRIVDARRRP